MRSLFLFVLVCLFSTSYVSSFAEDGFQPLVQQEQKKKVMQKTFAMIKPSGMPKAIEIKSIIKSYGLKIIRSKKIVITEKQVGKLYYMHKDKPFFDDLKTSLVGKEVEVMILYGDHAVSRYRDAVSDIRAKYAVNKTENAVHGSDNWKRAHEEICIFFEC